MYRFIDVPLDGRASSEHALPLAISIARAAQCRVEVVRVATPPALGTELYGAVSLDAQQMQKARQEAERHLRALARALGESASIEVAEVVLTGDVPDAIVRHIEDSAPDLIVMTTHDRGRLERLVLGSVAETVVQRAHIPALLVRAGEGHALLDPLPTIGHLLIPLDGSTFAQQVVPHAVTLAKVMHAKITLLSVIDPEPPRTPGSGSAIVHDPVAAAAIEQASLERIADALRAEGIVVQTSVLIGSQPARLIADYASQHSIDVIAMTTHGRGALHRLVAGSVAEEVVHTARTPTLVYRPMFE